MFSRNEAGSSDVEVGGWRVTKMSMMIGTTGRQGAGRKTQPEERDDWEAIMCAAQSGTGARA